VWICRDKQSGRPRGDGIVGYEVPQAASLAIDRFHSELIWHCCLASRILSLESVTNLLRLDLLKICCDIF